MWISSKNIKSVVKNSFSIIFKVFIAFALTQNAIGRPLITTNSTKIANVSGISPCLLALPINFEGHNNYVKNLTNINLACADGYLNPHSITNECLEKFSPNHADYNSFQPISIKECQKQMNETKLSNVNQNNNNVNQNNNNNINNDIYNNEILFYDKMIEQIQKDKSHRLSDTTRNSMIAVLENIKNNIDFNKNENEIKILKIFFNRKRDNNINAEWSKEYFRFIEKVATELKLTYEKSYDESSDDYNIDNQSDYYYDYDNAIDSKINSTVSDYYYNASDSQFNLTDTSELNEKYRDKR